MDENSRKYYDKQFSVVRAAKEQAKTSPSPSYSQLIQSPSPSNLSDGPHPSPPSHQARVERLNQEHLNIGDFQLVLKCSDRQVLQLSKQQLCSFFKSRNEVKTTNHHQGGPRVNYLAAKPPPPPTFKYSREELLMISENPQSKVTDNLKVGTIIANGNLL